MIKKNIYIIIGKLLVFIIIVTLIIARINNELYKQKEDNSNMVSVMGMIAPYKSFERELYSDYFRNIKKGTTLEDIEKDIGEPNGWFGSGIVRPYYEVKDDKYVILYLDFEGTHEIMDISICPINYTSYEDVEEIELN